MTIRKALTIAGSDTSGGAGQQADLKTFQELGVYGMTALTVIVAQNPQNNWAHDVYPLPLAALEAQLETVLAGIGADAVKTGMLATAEVIELVAKKLDQYKVQNIVIDPVLVCKGTDEVLHPETAISLRDVLAPRATVITPNLFEAGQLSGLGSITSVDAMKEAAKRIYELGAKAVVVKGGAKLGTAAATDVFYAGQDIEVLESPLVKTTYIHGAGCTFAAAVTAGLANGLAIRDAVIQAKDFTAAAISQGFALNQYVGPTWHGAYRSLQAK